MPALPMLERRSKALSPQALSSLFQLLLDDPRLAMSVFGPHLKDARPRLPHSPAALRHEVGNAMHTSTEIVTHLLRVQRAKALFASSRCLVYG